MGKRLRAILATERRLHVSVRFALVAFYLRVLAWAHAAKGVAGAARVWSGSVLVSVSRGSVHAEGVEPCRAPLYTHALVAATVFAFVFVAAPLVSSHGCL